MGVAAFSFDVFARKIVLENSPEMENGSKDASSLKENGEKTTNVSPKNSSPQVTKNRFTLLFTSPPQFDLFEKMKISSKKRDTVDASRRQTEKLEDTDTLKKPPPAPGIGGLQILQNGSNAQIFGPFHITFHQVYQQCLVLLHFLLVN
jgi:hypothetical protein